MKKFFQNNISRLFSTPKKVDVLLTVDFDGISLWNSFYKEKCFPGVYGRGLFGVFVGSSRLLDVFERNEVESTWFIPGTTAMNFPDEVSRVQSMGHEVGHHGYDHENPCMLETKEEELEIIAKGKKCLSDVLGIEPLGYRSPAWDFSFSTVEILEEEGFVYDSSLMENDFELKFARKGDSFNHESGAFTLGEDSSVVEIPVSWLLDDFPPREFILGNFYNQGLQNGDVVIDRFKSSFDYLYDNVGEGVFTVTMHPQTIGRSDMIQELGEFIQYMKLKEGVRFMTCSDRSMEFIETVS